MAHFARRSDPELVTRMRLLMSLQMAPAMVSPFWGHWLDLPLEIHAPKLRNLALILVSSMFDQHSVPIVRIVRAPL